jgi:competence protein ComFC
LFLSRLLAFFFPITCVVCGNDLPSDDVYRVCSRCRDTIKPLDALVCVKCGQPLDSGGAHCYHCKKGASFHFSVSRSAVRYEGATKKLIHAFKYAHRDYLAHFLGDILVDCVKKHPELSDIDMIMPVPLHWSKRWLRGYNQAEILGERVSAALDKPLISGVLVRRRRGRVQAALDRRQRLENMQGVMAVKDPLQIRGKKIMLIDDVATTCATLEACASALRYAGAGKVVCATVARD